MDIHNPTIKRLLKLYQDISLLSHIKSILDWDLNVYLPPEGSQARAIQSSYLTERITEKWLDTSFRSLYEKSLQEHLTTLQEKAVIRNIQYAGKLYYNVPKKLIVEKDKTASEAFVVWKQAREENNFKKFLPYLTKLIEYDRSIAQHIDYSQNPYDVLLDLYEPQLTVRECKRLFNGLQKELLVLIKKIVTSKEYTPTVSYINGSTIYPTIDQEKINRFLMQRMGFNFQAGRIDVSPHPFTTTLSHNDIRITTKYALRDFRESLTSTMHETGHALYEQGINPLYDNTPLEGGVSLGMHESLSRFWENMVGKNPSFLRFITPSLQTIYPTQLQTVDEMTFIRSCNIVKPDLIRIQADEVTYTLHIILRFEMEHDLINGTISPKDAAEVWKEKSKQLLGVSSPTDANGILQDVHWTYGAFGYFPSYALGNLYGAQFLATMKNEIRFDEELEKGNLFVIKDWLDKNIHQYGSLYFPKELLKRVTGKDLDYTYFVTYLKNKYSALYHLK